MSLLKKLILLLPALIIFITSSNANADIEYSIINQSLVSTKLMPVGTVVKIKVVKISDLFNTKLAIVCFPESPFVASAPGKLGYGLKEWMAFNIKEGDILNYTTTRKGFIGLSAGPAYREYFVDPVESGNRLTFNTMNHQWIVEVSFPDYEN